MSLSPLNLGRPHDFGSAGPSVIALALFVSASQGNTDGKEEMFAQLFLCARQSEKGFYLDASPACSQGKLVWKFLSTPPPPLTDENAEIWIG